MRYGTWKIAGLLGIIMAASASAQTQPGRPAGGPPDPAAMREQMVAYIKSELACTDDEWKVIEPKLVKVMLLKMDVGEFGVPGGGRMAVRINGFIRTILDPNALPSEVDEKMADLQKLISENETSNEAYKNVVGQLRKARQRARESLAAAEKDIADVLTLRQEAVLVQLGILD